MPNWRSSSGLTFAFTPGDSYGYSGEAYFWLQRVLEHITKVPFAQYMREHVLQPLGMLSSSFVLLPEMIANCASSHSARGKPSDGIYLKLGREYLKVAQLWSKPVETWTYDDAVLATREMHPATPDIPSPQNLAPNSASGLLTTAGDYARFMTHCMPGTTRNEHDLSEATRQEMLTPHSPRIRALSWGLGWALEREAGATSFWHSGSNRGFKNVVLADVEGRAGIVLLTNSDEGERLRWPIVHGFTGRGEAALL